MAVVMSGILCAMVMALGQVMVCSKCGFECKPEGDVCEQCGAVLPGKRAVGVEKDASTTTVAGGHTFGASGKLESFGLEAVNAEVALARKHLEGGDPALARLLFRNALALEKLTRSDAVANRAEALKESIKRCEVLSGAVRQPCPVCSGGTQTRMRTTGIKGDVRHVEVANTICPRCSGSKFIVKAETIGQWREKAARAGLALGVLEKERKLVVVNGAYVPVEIRDKLTFAQKAALGQVARAACPDCDGMGLVDCPDCLGLGEVKCPAKGCEMGQVVVETGGQLMKGKVMRTEKCPACKGTGAVPCPDCDGTGRTQCRKCKGTGLAPLCKKCDGTMLVDCRKCKGTGTFKDQPCPECSGEGRTLCPVCGNAEPR